MCLAAPPAGAKCVRVVAVAMRRPSSTHHVLASVAVVLRRSGVVRVALASQSEFCSRHSAGWVGMRWEIQVKWTTNPSHTSEVILGSMLNSEVLVWDGLGS